MLDSLLTEERRRFVKFAFVGGSGVAVNLLFVWVGLRVFFFVEPAPREIGAQALGVVVSVFTNYVLNSLWTWGDRSKAPGRRAFLARVLAYYLATALATLIQLAVALPLGQWPWLRESVAALPSPVGNLADLHLYVAQFVGIIAGMVPNYVFNNLWTFRDRGAPDETAPADPPERSEHDV